MAWDPVAHRVILITNYNPLSGAVKETWSWDGIDWTRLDTDPAAAHVVTPPARAYHAIAHDAHRGKTGVYVCVSSCTCVCV